MIINLEWTESSHSAPGTGSGKIQNSMLFDFLRTTHKITRTAFFITKITKPITTQLSYLDTDMPTTDKELGAKSNYDNRNTTAPGVKIHTLCINHATQNLNHGTTNHNQTANKKAATTFQHQFMAINSLAACKTIQINTLS